MDRTSGLPGTLFPQSSKKVARAINAASNNRPVVILANLSGFDGSPESMRRLQLEYGAEIGRAVVNFKGPDGVLRDLPLSWRRVCGFLAGAERTTRSRGAGRNVCLRHRRSAGGSRGFCRRSGSQGPQGLARLQALTQAMAQAEGAEKGRLRAQWDELFKVVHSEKLGEMAAEFDHVHSVQRALEVGALNCIIPPAYLRPYLIHAVERGIERKRNGIRRSQRPRPSDAAGLSERL